MRLNQIICNVIGYAQHVTTKYIRRHKNALNIIEQHYQLCKKKIHKDFR